MDKEIKRLYEFGPFVLDPGERLLRHGAARMELPPRAFDTLLALVENNGRLLEKEVSRIPGVKVAWKVEANGVFVQIPRHAIEKIKRQYFFYMWIEEESIVRWMCSFDTTEGDIRRFAEVVAESMKG